jgi:hypothetical protein
MSEYFMIYLKVKKYFRKINPAKMKLFNSLCRSCNVVVN